MDTDEFRRCGTDMVNYVADYFDTLRSRPVMPYVQHGFLKKLIPEKAPHKAESYEDVKKDLEDVVLKGVLHWRSPHFHAFVPLASSFPALIADMLVGALSSMPITWSANPSGTELEVAMMDWLGQMLKLPEEFLFSSGGKGGGVIQMTADDSATVAIIAARARAVREHGDMTPGQTLDKLVAYTSAEAHTCIKKAAQLALVNIRLLPTDENFSLRGQTLAAAIKEDKNKGFIPFFLGASVGTTSTIAVDNLCELGKICEQENVWMHIDAAYAGSAAICPEFRYLINGVEYSTSFCLNPHKWLHVNLLCSAMWIKDRELITEPFNVDPVYLRNHNLNGDVKMPDYRHWTIQLSRPFTSLKLWFVLRMYGVQQLQERIRKDVKLAKQFEALVRNDHRFEIVAQVVLGVVCFKLKGKNNDVNEELLKRINDDRRIYLTPSTSKGVFYLRFCIAVYTTDSKDVSFAWNIVQEQTDVLLGLHVNGIDEKTKKIDKVDATECFQ
ncbi:hypothetical protein RRG08_039804 [Elysia crispata]|uniref:Aromatic-L-amino-acid decarboxylase n=1 Tax=Elysia crispata TaxID=231223 RepID=A0AAE1E451_9GAST|nr:hypothetical protein RRG08_039804 [Elysia crispata]